jgi:tRNA U38,U39,U40 pseudouridine synthase TruA
MIRHLMTALWKVGNSRLSVEDFESLLKGPKQEGPLWKVAPAKGLFLCKIRLKP